MTDVLIGSKCDLAHQWAVNKEQGKQFAKGHGLLFLEASARTLQNVDELMVKRVILHYFLAGLHKDCCKDP
ncbi:hypothetical protein Nepgr_016857 [Nepenthes gracilis]|uniref:Uncharacterized protein n=1 Tax=Nepenthes gracilis TaxID=150966 RepID=A0AAD3XSR6_NEPGR|nr:hypothetical protein Nepgr_016857 [Nepenthes gracilis]